MLHCFLLLFDSLVLSSLVASSRASSFVAVSFGLLLVFRRDAEALRLLGGRRRAAGLIRLVVVGVAVAIVSLEISTVSELSGTNACTPSGVLTFGFVRPPLRDTLRARLEVVLRPNNFFSVTAVLV